MDKQMTLGKRIYMGFTLVILIALAIGVIGVWNMLTAKNNSEKLAAEYVPEAKIATELRGASNRLMYAMRGYGFTENDAHYQAAREEVATIQKHIKDAQKLADRAVHLEALEGQVEKVQAATGEYEDLMRQTEEIIGAMNEQRARLDQNAATYMENCEAFLNNQNEAFKQDLEERQKKVQIATDIVERGTRARVQNFRAQGTGDMELMQEAVAHIRELDAEVELLRPITRNEKDLEMIDTIEAAGEKYAGAMESYIETNKALEAAGKQMDKNAAAYMENTAAFLEAQNESMEKEFNMVGADLSQRLRKIGLVNDIIDAGNEARIINFRAQAKNEPELMPQAKEQMLAVSHMAEDLRKVTDNIDNLKQLAAVENAARGYAEAIDAYMDDYLALGGIRKEMDVAAGRYMANCEAFLGSQQQALEKDMQERHEKISLVNDIIDLGNDARVNAFKGQALRDVQYIRDAQANFPKLEEKYEALRKITRLKEDLDRIDQVQASGGNYAEALNLFVKQWDKLEDLGLSREETGNRVIEACKVLADAGMSNTEEIADEAAASLAKSSTVMIVGLIIGIIAAVFAALLITRGITKLLTRIIEGLNTGASEVASASEQVSSASQSLAEGASEQAASIEETSASLEEMSSMTKQNADNARQADGLMGESQQVVSKANESMGRLTGSMDEISKASEETSKIVKTIDEIAFQTNLLALNAAVEAARAGEAGAGFAVVADEVRNLAMRAAEAAKNTSELIEGTVKKVKEGSGLVTTTNEAFHQVAESAGKVAELVGEIAAASGEQAQGIEEVNKAVTEMDKVTQQNAANAEESASASEELNAQAEQMQAMVNDLVSLVGGSKSGSVAGQGGPAKTHHARTEKRRKNAKALAPASQKTGGGKELDPNKLIPLDDEDFKDF